MKATMGFVHAAHPFRAYDIRMMDSRMFRVPLTSSPVRRGSRKGSVEVRRLAALHSGLWCMVPLRSFPGAPLKLCAWGSFFHHCTFPPAIESGFSRCKAAGREAVSRKMEKHLPPG